MSSKATSADGEGMGEGPGVRPSLDKVIVTLRVVDGLTEGPSCSPGLDKVIVTPRVVV